MRFLYPKYRRNRLADWQPSVPGAVIMTSLIIVRQSLSNHLSLESLNRGAVRGLRYRLAYYKGDGRVSLTVLFRTGRLRCESA